MSAEDLDGVATFYNLIFRRPVGKHVIQVCDSVGFSIMGYDRMRGIILTLRLGIKPGETTADGQFTLIPICCLGTCDRAPAMLVDDRLYRDLSPEKIDGILEEYRQRVLTSSGFIPLTRRCDASLSPRKGGARAVIVKSLLFVESRSREKFL